MSFERTKGSITNLSGTEVSVDALLDMLVCVTRDVYENNGITNASSMKVEDQSVMLKKLYNLLKMLLTVYGDNQTGVMQFGERIRNDYIRMVDALKENEADIDWVVREIEAVEAKEAELMTSYKQLEKERGHLLQVKDECDELTRKIQILNDAKLDELAKMRDELDEELSIRREKSEALKKELDSTGDLLAKAEQKADEMKAELGKMNQEIRSLEQEAADCANEKIRLEENICQAQEKLAEAKRELSDLPEKAEAVRNEYNELQAMMTTMINAVNSAKSDEFVRGHLFNAGASIGVNASSDLAIVSANITDWKTLNHWFDEINGRIGGLMEAYRLTMAELVIQAENMTEKPKTDKT